MVRNFPYPTFMKIVAQNKKALFDYEILKKFKAGILLTGAEVKSIRQSKVNLKGSYVTPDKNAMWIENMHVSPYQPNNQKDYNPTRKRKLLLKQKEIEELTKAFHDKGQTIIGLAIEIEGKFIKLEIAIGRGKKKYDKRETIKKRDLDREMRKKI